MARSTSTSGRSSDAPRDAIALLKQDHRTVEHCSKSSRRRTRKSSPRSPQRVCQLLTVHAQIEEEILYPAAKEAFEDEETEDLVNEADVEHGSAKELIAKIEGMTPRRRALQGDGQGAERVHQASRQGRGRTSCSRS